MHDYFSDKNNMNYQRVEKTHFFNVNLILDSIKTITFLISKQNSIEKLKFILS